MPTATLTAKGQVVIPAEIRSRYALTPGTQIEFVDQGDGIALKVRRRVTPTDPSAGFGMFTADPAKKAVEKLSDFDPASLLTGKKSL